MKTKGKYILMGKLAVPETDLLKWAMFFGSAEHYVDQTIIGPILVSTVFLGLEGQLFETMIFRGGHGEEMWRYASWEEAEAGHAKAVDLVRAEIVTKAMGEEPQ